MNLDDCILQFPKQGILAVKPMHIFTSRSNADCRRESK